MNEKFSILYEAAWAEYDLSSYLNAVRARLCLVYYFIRKYSNGPLCLSFRTYRTCFIINLINFVFILLLCAKFEDILNE